jgi:hypothetical protein
MRFSVYQRLPLNPQGKLAEKHVNGSVKSEKNRALSVLHFFSLLIFVPGLFGLVMSAVLSTIYVANLPRIPDPSSHRLTPRQIHGITVYETIEEDRTFAQVEYGALAFFLLGSVLTVVYIEKNSGTSEEQIEQ